MTDNREPIKSAPLSKYIIHHSNGDGTGKTIYTDDRPTAVEWSKKPGVLVTALVYGIGYENINKVMEAEEC